MTGVELVKGVSGKGAGGLEDYSKVFDEMQAGQTLAVEADAEEGGAAALHKASGKNTYLEIANSMAGSLSADKLKGQNIVGLDPDEQKSAAFQLAVQMAEANGQRPMDKSAANSTFRTDLRALRALCQRNPEATALLTGTSMGPGGPSNKFGIIPPGPSGMGLPDDD